MSDKIMNEADTVEKLREMAKIASIYHRNRTKLVRNRNLSHVVHAGLHLFQFIISLVLILFHHIHHYVNRQRRKEDESVPYLPEETNVIFLIYPLCMLASLTFAAIWISTDIFRRNPKIVLIGCFVAASLMFIIGIVEMKHADWYLDLTEINDDELLVHPIFIHNFIMCLISIFCMSIYLIQGWILLDYYQWIRKQSGVSDLQYTDSETGTDAIQGLSRQDEIHKTVYHEAPGKLVPIATLDTLPSLQESKTLNIDEEDVIFYCCFVDWYNYLKQRRQMDQPLHEFQVIHVM
ncbi:uncharacterized protein LOC122572337 [Bombus pyrosoma]|uniref:uncharacterized protein LOC122572337 n=1 Tax=Bombus pyrosoma TaxID=396416 RepID=UPI001CB9B065|nr:uncharacterized protein LOC122572337 [Bombus pyrosoma]